MISRAAADLLNAEGNLKVNWTWNLGCVAAILGAYIAWGWAATLCIGGMIFIITGLAEQIVFAISRIK